MTTSADYLADARLVADAILYEGYLLYPYRSSAGKNQSRFQFGVLMPAGYRAVDDCEPSASQTECLLECPVDAEVTVAVRFLHLQRRAAEEADGAGGFRPVASLQVAGSVVTTWDEAAERERQLTVPVAALLAGGVDTRFEVPGGETAELLTGDGGQLLGRLVRRQAPLAGLIRLAAEPLPGPYGGLRLRLVIENHTEPDGPLRDRADGLRLALIATHALIHVPGGRFLSLTDPPEWAAPQAAACVNTACWPVLAGPEGCQELVLSSPVILYDHPQIAPESAGDLFDATEIDEILTLRTMALTDEEKREARATDPRSAALLDRVDHLPPEMLERLHGAIRYLGPTATAAGPAGTPVPAGGLAPAEVGAELAAPLTPWWDPGADASVSPETDYVLIGGARVARGSAVLMRPGTRRADAQDLFLAGRTATVQAVFTDVDGNVHLAVTPDGDPAADLQQAHGRFLYFAPDEIEPIQLSANEAEPIHPSANEAEPNHPPAGEAEPIHPSAPARGGIQ